MQNGVKATYYLNEIFMQIGKLLNHNCFALVCMKDNIESNSGSVNKLIVIMLIGYKVRDYALLR